MSLASAQADLIGAFNDFLTQCRAQIAPASANPAVTDPVGVTNLLQQVLVVQQQLLQEIKTMSDSQDAFTNEIAQLRADVAAQSTVIGSATAAFTGLAARLAAAESHATAAGATPEQIAAVTAVRTDLEANTASLASAIPQNTPAATQGTPAPTPAPAPAADTGTPAPTPTPAPAPAADATTPAASAPAPVLDTTAQPAPAPAPAADAGQPVAPLEATPVPPTAAG